jgi:NAD kinase
MINNSNEKVEIKEAVPLSTPQAHLLGVSVLPENGFCKESLDKFNIFVVKKINDEKCLQYSIDIIKIVQSYKSQIYVEPLVLEEYKTKNVENFNIENIKAFDAEKDERIIDLLITIGGDGTILWALKYFQHKSSPPIITFDRGTIGYMCHFGLTNFEEKLRQIFTAITEKKAICIEKKMRISCQIIRKDEDTKTFLALNEGIVDRGPSPLAVKLDCFLEDNFVTTFDGDGVIMSTPNGSTAYQLSAGGPIIHSLVPSVVLTPICSHSLSTRPIVLPIELNITIKVNKDARSSAWFSCDGLHRVELRKDDVLYIRKTDHQAIFITDGCKGDLDNWLLRLRNLLGWNQKKYYNNETKYAT